MSIDIPEVVRKALGATEPLHLASVVDTEGPCYRRIGARMLIGAGGRLAGSVSGGCLERELVERSWWLTENGPRVQTYDTSADGDEVERSYLGCGGTVRVLIERAESETLEVLAWVAQQTGPCAIVTVLTGTDAALPSGSKFAASLEAD